MKKLILSTVLTAGIILGGLSAIAAGESANEIIAQLDYITSNSDTLKVRDETGKIHSFELENSEMLEGLEVGDIIRVEIFNGKARSIKKLSNQAKMDSASDQSY